MASGSRGGACPSRAGHARPLQRFYSPVAGGPLADLTVAPDRVGGLIQHGGEAQDALAFRLKLEQPLFHLGAEIDARSDLERNGIGVEVDVLELGLGRLDDALVRDETLLELLLGGALTVVVDVGDLRCLEGPAFGQLDEPEALTALDDHVEAAVVEGLEHLDDTGASPDLANPLVVSKDEAELLVVLDAFADQFAILGLEDVQGRLLSRQEHEVEGKEPELAHN